MDSSQITFGEPLGSARLQFEPLRPEHASELFEPLSDPRVHEFIHELFPATIAALADRFAYMVAGPRQRSDLRWLNFVVRLRSDSKLIGRLEAAIVERRAEVAYLFGPQHWGQGYATEAMAALQSYLRQTWNVGEFWATTSPDNLRSIRLLGRLGYEAVSDGWPTLMSYDTGDLVFTMRPGS